MRDRVKVSFASHSRFRFACTIDSGEKTLGPFVRKSNEEEARPMPCKYSAGTLREGKLLERPDDGCAGGIRVDLISRALFSEASFMAATSSLIGSRLEERWSAGKRSTSLRGSPCARGTDWPESPRTCIEGTIKTGVYNS